MLSEAFNCHGTGATTMGCTPLVVVSGGAGGIGRAIATRFAAAGARLVIADLNETAGREVASGLADAAYTRLDVADAEDVEAFVSVIESEIGGIGVLVNSAGLLQNLDTSAAMPLEEHDRIWSVNYRGTYLMCRAVGPRMAERGKGAILNIASVNSFTPLPLPAYNPTKWAVDGLTKVLAGEGVQTIVQEES